jgi:hypothetical protein
MSPHSGKNLEACSLEKLKSGMSGLMIQSQIRAGVGEESSKEIYI